MPSTKVIRVSSDHPDHQVITEAAGILRKGGLVAFPTETVYGLGADVFNKSAIARVFEAKQRPGDNPLIVHVADADQLSEVADSIPSSARRLAEAFWPGPLTLVVNRSPNVPDLVTANLETVAVRMPDHRVTLALIKELGRGIVGPSANVSGTPSPTKAEHVYADLAGTIELILDSGPTSIGVESTIIDVTSDPPVVLRLGGAPVEEIEEVVGLVEVTDDLGLLRRSPGTRHRHYAPKATVIVVRENDLRSYRDMIQTYAHKRVGCIVHSKLLREYEGGHGSVVRVESTQDLSRKLYDTFRRFDKVGTDIILVEAISQQGLGGAIMDRVMRAANNRPPTKSSAPPTKEQTA